MFSADAAAAYRGSGAGAAIPPMAASVAPSSASTSAAVTRPADGRLYSLEVGQQPIRARMCGFGDKDRRPITPPPCVRLVVRDATTHAELDPNTIDTTFFVLIVDLWSDDGSREVNLVRHSASSPSISAASTASYPPPPQNPPPSVASASAAAGIAMASPVHPPAYGAPGPFGSASASGYMLPPQYPQQPPPPPPAIPGYASFYSPSPYAHPAAAYHYPGSGMPLMPPQPAALPSPHTMALPAPSPPSGMFTRNLIGSLTASAFKLTDDRGRLGVWFILQDLSVRTEGTFRLKMSFVDVGVEIDRPDDEAAERGGVSGSGSVGGEPPAPTLTLNTGSAPILASVFSDTFMVYSAKKFPGVIESTALSKCFANQGIKIPIRKDGVKRKGEEDD